MRARPILVLFSMLTLVSVVCCAPVPQAEVAIAPVTPVVYPALPTYGYTAYAAPALYTPYSYPYSFAYGYSYYLV